MIRSGAEKHGARGPGLLSGMRIRKKLLLLHTVFSVALAAVLLLTVRPAVTEIVTRAEADEAVLALELSAAEGGSGVVDGSIRGVTLVSGSASELGLTGDEVERAAGAGGGVVPGAGGAVRMLPAVGADGGPLFVVARARIPEARRAVFDVYLFVVVAVLGVYGLIALASELLVLPQSVYRPIRRMLEADLAVQRGDAAREIIPERVIPDDELGEIMRSRNDAVLALRRNERELGEALARVEQIAADLKRKNHLLEAARRHLADADRLASLGMMSAGIAHELNTPLTVVKGLAEKLESSSGRSLSAEEAALLLRVVRRLEGLGESLLDFARVRPPRRDEVGLAEVVGEAMTLVRLDRGSDRAMVVSQVGSGVRVLGDADRLVQVFVNLIRNGVDAVRSGPASGTGRVTVSAERLDRDGALWVAVRVADDGPGIEAGRLERVFEPFVSTKLDSRGTGLGLAVAEGIVREHGGVLVATNRPDRRGAVFEVLLPSAGGIEAKEAADG